MSSTITLAGGYRFAKGTLIHRDQVVHSEATPLSVGKVNALSKPRQNVCVGKGMKRCPQCQSELPANTENFQRDKHSSDGLTGWCKPCRSTGRKASYRKVSSK